MKKLLPYLAVIIADFYLLPLAIRNTGAAMVMMLVIMPLICFVCSVVCGVKNGFSLPYFLISAALFIPTIFMYYNGTEWNYALMYLPIIALGNALGTLSGGITKMKALRIALLIAAMAIGGISGTWLLPGFEPLKVLAFFAICGGLGQVFHLIDKRITK